MSWYKLESSTEYKGRVLIDNSGRYWVVAADISEKKIIVINECEDSFLINNTHAEGRGGRDDSLVEGVYNWRSNPVTAKGTYAYWMEAAETTDEYRAMIPLIADAKERMTKRRLELQVMREEALKAREQEIEMEMALEQEAEVNYDTHASVPGMWYCYIIDKKGAVVGAKYFNPQYVREITPLAKANVYKFKLAGYHQVEKQTLDFNSKDTWGFSYVNVWTKFD